MTGSVYPCESCAEQNWVKDIDDSGLCPKCRNLLCGNCGYEVDELEPTGLCQTCQRAYDMGRESK
jgi:hypothetical protein